MSRESLFLGLSSVLNKIRGVGVQRLMGGPTLFRSYFSKFVCAPGRSKAIEIRFFVHSYNAYNEML